MERVGITLSGGGYRAAAFSLGVVHYLNDIGRLEDIAAISSVSGGSITNGFLATRMVGNEPVKPERQRAQLAMLSSALAHQSLISAKFMAGIGLFLLASVLVQILVNAAVLPSLWEQLASLWDRFGFWLPLLPLAGIVVLLVLMIEWLVRNRLRVLLIDASQSTWWPKNKTTTDRLGNAEATLADLAGARYAPIFCATDLATGTPFYLSGRFVAGSAALLVSRRPGSEYAGPEMVAGFAGTVRLRNAILASASFPGLLPPQFFSSHKLGLPLREGSVLAKTCLADGGLRDNLGLSFFWEWAKGRLPPSVTADVDPVPDAVIVVNSGVPQRKSPRSGRLRRIRTIPLCVDVIHQSNTQSIIDRLRREGIGFPTCIVSIDDDPWEVLAQATQTEAVTAAGDALRRLSKEVPSMTHSWWRARAQQSDSSVRTRLTSLGSTTTAHLLFHAYISTMVQTATVFGWSPPITLPSVEDFEKLCQKRTTRGWRRFDAAGWPADSSATAGDPEGVGRAHAPRPPVKDDGDGSRRRRADRPLRRR